MVKQFSRRIAPLCILTAVLIVPASRSFADDAVSPAGAKSKSLLFSMIMLTPAEYAGGVGFKYYISDPFALRGNLQFGIAGTSTPAPTGGSDGSASAVQFGISAGGEYHFLRSRVSPFAGFDLGIKTTSTDSKSTTNPQIETKNSAVGETISGITYIDGLNFRAGAIGGIEFFILKELSIGAEYNLGYSVTSLYDQVVTTNGNPSVSQTTKEGSNYSFGFSAVGAFTLAFYF